MDNQAIVKMCGISKSFPGVKALDGVDFTLAKASVHGLVGENGAGKSTLVKILSGAHCRDSGEVIFDDKTVNFKNEREALNAGISIVLQELSYIPRLTIEENIFLGREPAKFGFLKKSERTEMATELINDLGLDFNPKSQMGRLTIAQCQMVEIIKAISRDAKVIIMDEPTSSLTTMETRQLFEHVKAFKKQGYSIVYISHKLEEILELCDTITVLRDAKLVGSMTREEATEQKIISMMVGREMGKLYPPVGKPTGGEVLRVENLTQQGVFTDISFSIRAGEVIGFSGMMGAGRSEVMRALFGLDKYSLGEVYVDGKKQTIRSPRDAIRLGFGMVTEDRARYGFVPGLSVSDNIVLPNAKEFSKAGFLEKKRIRKVVTDITKRLAVRIPHIREMVRNLSGGNQQKVVLSKWLIRDVKIMIIDEPTRGIDVGAKQEIYNLIKELAEQGMAIILVSSEMQEVIGVSQRIIVMDSGRILKEFTHEDVTQDKIMQTIIEGGRKL
ncbi:MAG: sugar ABC transporter ATP-binding protein [Oscillospiraceae bacterium]|nr:sugar ABC transporter ATP-binding protein [Oscillospiraceae bacterium]MCL2278373.1 sugar ABC transporter ATP-binding protein [Oscillospiraceae bacterium]